MFFVSGFAVNPQNQNAQLAVAEHQGIHFDNDTRYLTLYFIIINRRHPEHAYPKGETTTIIIRGINLWVTQ
jgi:hypothetical protein